MEIIEFLKHPVLELIVEQHNKTKLQKKQVSYNLFTISSYNSYLENFHSDIIASLLNPEGLHQQGKTFLNLFINYLNKYYSCNITVDSFQNAVVSRETGRLDIWIRNENPNQSIIIENKINNAPDMDEQIDRYFAYAENARKYPVKAVIYLSLDGKKKAPPTIEKLDHLVKDIGAFTNSESDLVNGWLQHCLDNHGNKDSFSVIHQYIKLIKHLANLNMDTETVESFYRFINEDNKLEYVNSVIELNQRIPEYRAYKFVSALKGCAPFKINNMFPLIKIFQNYYDNNYHFRIDFEFKQDGTVKVRFFTPDNYKEDGFNAAAEKLKSIGLNDGFKVEELKHFRIFGPNANTTLIDTDNAVLAFFTAMLLKLQS